MGAVVGFVIGVFVGMLVTAFFFRRSNVLRHDRRHRRRRHDLEDHGNERKSECFDYIDPLYFLSGACISVPSQIILTHVYSLKVYRLTSTVTCIVECSRLIFRGLQR